MTLPEPDQQPAHAPTAKPKLVLPLWAKALLFLFLAGTLLIVAQSATFIYNLGHADDPAYIAATTKTIVRFTPSLPAGFRFDRAFAWGPFASIILVNEPDKTVITFIKQPNYKEQSAKQIITELQANQRQTGGLPNLPVDVETSGTIAVGGQEMPYVIGTPPGIQEKNQQCFSGAIVRADKKTAILVNGITPSSHYNMEATKQLLDSIISF